MTTAELYDRFPVTPELRTHMIRVAQLTSLLADICGAEPSIRLLMLQCALVHDLGNLVVFKKWFGEDQQNQTYWEGAQAKAAARYGISDHEATRQMLEEANVSPEITRIVLAKSYNHAVQIADSDDWPLKVLFYADLRTSPTGIETARNRLDELRSRSEKYKDRDDLFAAAQRIEAQLQVRANRDLLTITARDYTVSREELMKIAF